MSSNTIIKNNVEGARSSQSVDVDVRSTKSDNSRSSRPGPACSKVGARAEVATPEGALSRAGSTASLGSLGGESRKRAAEFVVSSSDSEGESTKRSRGGPALNPENVGKFTAEARAKKADKAKARQLRRDHRAIIDPDVELSSASVKRARDRAIDLAIEFDQQPLCSVAAVATRELATIARAVEKSKNIKGDIIRDLWAAYSKLSAALSSVMARSGDGRDRGRSTSRCTSGRDRARGLEWDSTMEWSGPESLAGARSPVKTRSRKTAPSEGEEPRPRVTVTEEDLRSPYFRPPLQGVAKQLNPLAAVADRTAPVGKKSPSNKKKGGTDRADDEESRIERILERLLPRLLKGMGVVPVMAPPPKAPPVKKAGQPPASKGAKTASKAGGKVPGVPPPAARREPSPPAVSPTTGTVSRAAKRAATKAAKTEAAPPRQTLKSAKAPAAPAPTKKGNGGKMSGGARKGSAAVGPQASGKKAPLPKLRSPSSAAITVTCADPTSYQEVVGKARSSISLKDVGIEDLRPRRAITGALIWEVRGPESREKADKLAERLAAVFADRDDVKVSRPTKTAEIRVSGLDDSATPTEVADELAKACG